MRKANTMMFPLPYTSSDSTVTNDALSLFFEHLIAYYDDDLFGSSIKSEEQMCDYITQVVIDELELIYRHTSGYMYTGTPQPITALEQTIYINNEYFNQLVKYLSKHIYQSILPEISRTLEKLRRNRFKVSSTNLEWNMTNPTLLTATIIYY